MSNYRYKRPSKLTSLSIVLPAHDEAENIGEVVTAALRVARTVTDDLEVLVVNDGSTDDTAAIVQEFASEDAHVQLLNNEQNMGYGLTLKRGLASSTKDWVFFTDADGQFSLSELKRLVAYTDSHDFVVGYRKKRKDPFRRKLNAGVFNVAVRLFFGIKVKDVDCAFKLMRRTKLETIELESESAMINTELLHKAQKQNMTIKEVAVTHLPRTYGRSSGGRKDVILRAVKEFYKLRYRFLQDPKELLRFNSFVVCYASIAAGLIITVWSYRHHTILAFGDAEAHINIAKRTVSGLTAGLAQLGSVWLPLPHLLMAPFALDNFLWRSGLAGSIVSVSVFVWLCVVAYRLAYELTSNFVASYVAPAVLIFNPNLLYIASTPMTETLLLSMVTSAVYYFTIWLKYKRLSSFIAMSFFTMAATLSRYDGWPLACLLLFVVPTVAVYHHKKLKAAEGMTFAFAYVGFFGIGLWLLWNKLIFGSFSYFANSVYGSKEQQMFFLRSGYLPTYHNIVLSFQYFGEDMRQVAGLPLLLIASLGVVWFAMHSIKNKKTVWICVALLTLTPIAFYVLSLYLGQASLMLPEYAKPGARYTISNVRYGIQILLAVALFVAYVGSKIRVTVPLLLLIVFAQSYAFLGSHNVIVYTDATVGLSSQKISKGADAPPAEAYLHSHYQSGLVLMDDYRNPIGLVESGIPMNKFIGSGNKPYWQEALDDPAREAEWVVLQKASSDSVWTHMTHKAILYDHYSLVYRSGGIFIYHRKSTQNMVAKSGQHLTLNGKPFSLRGVNYYDLLAQSDATIQTAVQNVSASGMNTMRLWCFNKQGGMTVQDFTKLDYILTVAQKDHVKIICTLSNMFSDYGGIGAFGANSAQQFFTDPAVIQKYEQYVDSVVMHVNATTHRSLRSDSTIAAWELINEPRLEGAQNGNVIAAWVEQVGQHLLSQDPNHLLSPGTEGFVGGGTGGTAYGYGEEHGSDITQICGLDVVSLCSAHLYPKYLSNDQPTAAAVNSIVQQWRQVGDKTNKPIILGEVGYDMSANGASQDERVAFMQSVASAVSGYQVDGALAWNLGSTADSSYTLQYGDPGSDAVLSTWATTGR